MIEVIGSDGRVRARVIPAVIVEKMDRADAVDPRIIAEFTKNVDELKRRARQPATGVTTEELLRKLNALSLPS